MPSSSHSQHGSSPRPSPSIGETNPNRPFIATAVGVPDMAPFSAFQPYVATSRPRTTYPPQASPFPPQTPTSSRGSCMPPTPPNGGIGKDYLMRERKDGLYPSNCRIKYIVRIMHKNYTDPWPLWSEIPKLIRELWFKMWKNYVCWDPWYEEQMWRAFNARGGKRLRQIFYEALW
ncbi:hypothetical protein CDL15_Pgr011961 [Punica granatum]|nr:hypothetical protein CDL15_Pgr011961 [Punica granatum]